MPSNWTMELWPSMRKMKHPNRHSRTVHVEAVEAARSSVCYRFHAAKCLTCVKYLEGPLKAVSETAIT